ncbi:MAG TPA: toxin-antitoxin system HicB family antitoxin [Chloroflexota bacterium]|nr:toxin-antitoxin system HicB family antitoxin [Chloroflexota bacterium]
MKLPYRMEVYRDGDYWAAEFPQLPGLAARAERWEDLEREIEDAKRAWFETMIELGREIPMPRTAEAYSGKLQLRLPRSLHAQAARASERDGVSLNTFIVTTIAKELGQKRGWT